MKKEKLNLILAITFSTCIGFSLGFVKRNIDDYKIMKYNILETKVKMGNDHAIKYCEKNLNEYKDFSIFDKYLGIGHGVKKASMEYLEKVNHNNL